MRSLKVSFLFLILLVSTIQIDIQDSLAQEEDFIRIYLDQTIGLRGEKLDLSVYHSYIGFNLKIYDPDNFLIHNKDYSGNRNLSLPIDDLATYGFYRIVATIPTLNTVRWFTVLDITNWKSVDFPYQVSHKGLDYIFENNYTIQVGELTINLRALKLMADRFNLDVTVLNNSMNFLVRFRKNTLFQLDILFSFIYEGCKITINGTQDKARLFTFKFTGQNLRKTLNAIRKGNVVFDYSDIKEAFSYDPTAQTLTFYLPKSFLIDPYIFESGFETGDFSEWDGTSGSPLISSDIVHHGTYAMKFETGTSGYVYEVLPSSYSVLWIRFYVYFVDLPTSGGNGMTIFSTGTNINTDIRVRKTFGDEGPYWWIDDRSYTDSIVQALQ